MTLRLWFDHGLGDCVHFAAMLQLYRHRGIEVAVHYDANKRTVFEACQIPYTDLEGTIYHPFLYYDGFNAPEVDQDWSSNKLATNFVAPLPDIGTPAQCWDELCGLDLSGSIERAITPEARAKVDRFLEPLDRPYMVLHLAGTNLQFAKNLPDHTHLELYRRLLDATNGTVILLDWDNRVPVVPHGRIRHLKDDFGHASLEELGALLQRADLLIGVDSGPYHFAALTDCPALGVFHHHYPSCITLPRRQSAVMTRNADSYRPINRHRRARWSILEYAGEYPSAEDIARHALRILDGPRYLTNSDQHGRDVMLQQWTRDWLRQSTSTSPWADRDLTMDYVLRILGQQMPEDPLIVETGCARGVDDWAAGCSTYLWAAFLDALGSGQLISVDNSAHHLATSRDLVRPWTRSRHELVESDSVEWLLRNQQPISLLYLDSLDCEDPGHSDHALREARVAQRCLGPDSLILIDDTTYRGGWVGKGAQAVPWLLGRGWRVLRCGYQVLLGREVEWKTAWYSPTDAST